MSKTLIVILLVSVMAIGGTAFAAYVPAPLEFLGLTSQNVEGNGNDEEIKEENDEANGDGQSEDEMSETAIAVHKALTADAGLSPGDEDFGRTVSENARAGGSEFGQSVAAAARNANGAEDENDEENGEGERSETAQAVHEALTASSDGDGLKPGDEGFGKAVSENAKAGGSDFGQSVAEAARGSNGNANAGGRGNAPGNGGGRP